MKFLDKDGVVVNLKIGLRDKNGCFVLREDREEAEYVKYDSNHPLARILLDGFDK